MANVNRDYKNKVIPAVILVILLIIYIIAQFFTSYGVPDYIVKMASEAGLVGGLADWFAVTALFGKPLGLPIPHTNLIENNREKIINSIAEAVSNNWLSKRFLKNQIEGLDFINIIENYYENKIYIKNESDEISGGKKIVVRRGKRTIQSIVRKYLLVFLKYSKSSRFKEGLKEKILIFLSREDLSKAIEKSIEEFVRSDMWGGAYSFFNETVARDFLNSLDAIKLSENVSNEIKNAISENDFIKKFVLDLIDKNFNGTLLYTGGMLKNFIHDNNSKIKKKIKYEISLFLQENYKKQGRFKSAIVSLLETVNVINTDSISENIIITLEEKIEELMDEIKNEPWGETARGYKEFLTDLVTRDLLGSSSLEEGLQDEIKSLIVSGWEPLKNKIIIYLSDGNTKEGLKNAILDYLSVDGKGIRAFLGPYDNDIKLKLSELISGFINDWIIKNRSYILNRDKFSRKFNEVSEKSKSFLVKYREKANGFLKDSVINIMLLNHGRIKDLVKKNLESLETRELIRQIESKIGSDLQYIRINGSLIGFLIGGLIAAIGIALKHSF